MILELELQGLPKIFSNGSHGHWRGRHSEAKKWKRLVYSAAEMFVITDKNAKGESVRLPMSKANLTLTRCSSVEPDFDGLVISFKNVIDGLVEAGVIAGDKVSNIGQPKYEWIKAKPKMGKIKVRVESAA